MSQQSPVYNEDRIYKRRLFFDNGVRYVEVKGKIVKEYKPPTPSMKSAINAHIQSPSGLVSGGTSHYSASVSMLFYSKKDYADWLMYVGAEHKYYDEKGSVYVGLVNGEPRVESVELETKYMVAVDLVLIRKQEFEFRHKAPFVDIETHWAKQFLEEMQEKGLVSVYSHSGEPVQYFRPEDHLTRAEGAAFLVRTFTHLERLLRGY